MFKFALAAVLAAAAVAPAEAAVTVAGVDAGVFTNVQPSTSATAGAGTSVFSWGIAQPTLNRLSFVGGAFTGTLGTAFKVGTLSYFNGTTSASSLPNTVDLALTFALTAPRVTTSMTTLTLGLISTPNTGTADENADYVNLPSAFNATTFSYMGQTYNFVVTGFRNVQGDGFLASNSSQLHVREGGTASADLYAMVSLAAVPEPATWAMMIVGFAAVGLAARRRTPAARLSYAA